MFCDGIKEKAHTTIGESMKQKNIRLFFNGILFVAISLFHTQLLPFLKKVGYNATQRNMIMACNALCSILFQVLFGYLCDRYKSMKKFFILSYAILLGFGIWMFSIHENHLLLHINICEQLQS